MVGRGFDRIKDRIPFDSIGIDYVQLEKLPEIYAISTCYICPSIDDAGPMMVNQSLCCGTPVVGFEIGSVLQVVSIIDEVAETGVPEFPFCLAWANESWNKKMWNKDCSGDKLLIEQTYGGKEDCHSHYLYARKLFENKNYIRVENKPFFFLIYKPQYHPFIQQHIELWNQWIRQDGIADSIYFVANLDYEKDKQAFLDAGLSAVTPSPNARALYTHYHTRRMHAFIADLKRDYLNIPFKISMKNVNKNIISTSFDILEDVIPVLYPQWDHSPRSGKNAFVVTHSTPELFRQQVKKMLSLVENKNNKIIMLKSWNEWAEGNYMEPDTIHGRSFIDVLGSEIKQIS